MSPVVPIIVIATVAFISILYLWWSNKKDQENESTASASASVPVPVRYSNPDNNHDHLKHPHSSQRSAEAEVKRMKRRGRTGSDRLQSYYNRERKAWYVGRGQGY